MEVERMDWFGFVNKYKEWVSRVFVLLIKAHGKRSGQEWHISTTWVHLSVPFEPDPESLIPCHDMA